MIDKQTSESASALSLAFFVSGPLLANFFILLQQGVGIRRRVGCTVDVFLRQEIGASPETIERIQSIMLDGKPVDEIGAALVRDSSTLALSAAMPGLVGATLRRGGSYASFRSAITYQEEGQGCDLGEGSVTVKVFNLLMAELGPGLFQRGVLLEAAVLLEFLAARKQEFRQGCSARLDGRPVAPERLHADRGWANGRPILLTVSSGQDGS